MKIRRCRLATLAMAIMVGGLTLSQGAGVTDRGPAMAAENSSKEYKILYVMSYHSPWRWTDGQLDGFKEPLKDLKIEYKVFQMDTKRYSAKEQKEAKGQEARQLIDTWKPDLVYTSDDDAQEYLVKHFLNKSLPFVFSGVNNDPKTYGFLDSKNVTGIVEHEHFVESVKLLKEIVPSVKRLAVVLDEASMWEAVVERMKEKAPQLPDITLMIWDKIHTFREYQQKIKEYETKVDAIALLGIFNFKDDKGKNVAYQDVLKWTAENSKLPDFSYWIDRVHYGTLCAVNVSEYEQGLAAGKIARGILVEGKIPSSFPMKPTIKGVPVVSLARANKLGLKIKSGVLLSSEVIQKFEWEK